VDDLGKADQLIRSGRYDLALPVFQAFGPNVAAALRHQVQFRLALCLEGLGRWDEALAAYRALLPQNPNRQVVVAAEAGLGRVWLRSGQPAEARDLLCRQRLRSALDAEACPAALEEARYVLALALAAEATPPPAGISLERLLEAKPTHWPIERTLTWVSPAPETPPPKAGPEEIAAQKVPARPGARRVRVSVTQKPVAVLLDTAAALCGLRSQWSAKALEKTEGRVADVYVENGAFQDLARDLACPLGLAWQIRDDEVVWFAVEEQSAEDHRAFRVALARRALREAAAADPEHELTATAYLALGNLEAEAGRLAAAVAWYERLTRDQPQSPLRVEAHYNLGLIEQGLGHPDVARKTFYRVVDEGPARALAAQAYLAVGRSWLEEGRPDQAVSPLRRGLAVAPGSPAQPAIVLNLAASYLWAGSPQSANALLRAHQAQFNPPPYRQTAGFLDALSRFEAAWDRRQVRHANDLLAAALNLQQPADLGSLGALLVGRAYHELGLIDQMAAVYDKALPQARGPVAEEMSYTLAEGRRSAGKVDEAKKLLLALAARGDGRWSRAAKLRLAELTLQDNRPEEALWWCRQLLPVQPPEQLPALLHLMGRAFERLGNYDQAARCFRGDKPS
jgi:tetratricopeptide (TPR) repeat protein